LGGFTTTSNRREEISGGVFRSPRRRVTHAAVAARGSRLATDDRTTERPNDRTTDDRRHLGRGGRGVLRGRVAPLGGRGGARRALGVRRRRVASADELAFGARVEGIPGDMRHNWREREMTWRASDRWGGGTTASSRRRERAPKARASNASFLGRTRWNVWLNLSLRM